VPGYAPPSRVGRGQERGIAEDLEAAQPSLRPVPLRHERDMAEAVDRLDEDRVLPAVGDGRQVPVVRDHGRIVRADGQAPDVLDGALDARPEVARMPEVAGGEPREVVDARQVRDHERHERSAVADRVDRVVERDEHEACSCLGDLVGHAQPRPQIGRQFRV